MTTNGTLKAERDWARAEADNLRAYLRLERDLAAQDRNALRIARAERDASERERILELRTARDMRVERDATYGMLVVACKERVTAERDRDAALAELEAARKAVRETLTALERAQSQAWKLREQRDVARAERDAARRGQTAAEQEQDR